MSHDNDCTLKQKNFVPISNQTWNRLDISCFAYFHQKIHIRQKIRNRWTFDYIAGNIRDRHNNIRVEDSRFTRYIRSNMMMMIIKSQMDCSVNNVRDRFFFLVCSLSYFVHLTLYTLNRPVLLLLFCLLLLLW